MGHMVGPETIQVPLRDLLDDAFDRSSVRPSKRTRSSPCNVQRDRKSPGHDGMAGSVPGFLVFPKLDSSLDALDGANATPAELGHLDECRFPGAVGQTMAKLAVLERFSRK